LFRSRFRASPVDEGFSPRERHTIQEPNRLVTQEGAVITCNGQSLTRRCSFAKSQTRITKIRLRVEDKVNELLVRQIFVKRKEAIQI
jgi:hypothetical protein